MKTIVVLGVLILLAGCAAAPSGTGPVTAPQSTPEQAAARAGIVESAKNIHRMSTCIELYEKGTPNPVDAKKQETVAEGVERDMAVCQIVWGKWYEAGSPLEQSFDKAREWYAKGAAKLPEGHIELARMAELGLGQPKNLAEALRLYQLAAAKNHAAAQLAVGRFHERGLGVAADAKAAADWYRKAVYRSNAYTDRAWKALIDLHAAGLVDTAEQLARDQKAWQQVVAAVATNASRDILRKYVRQNPGPCVLKMRFMEQGRHIVTVVETSNNPAFDAALTDAFSAMQVPAAPFYTSAERSIEFTLKAEWKQLSDSEI